MPPSKRKTRGGSGASESSDVSPAKVGMCSIQRLTGHPVTGLPSFDLTFNLTVKVRISPDIW